MEQLPKQYRSSANLEQELGDPFDPNTPFSFKRSLELDELEAYPEEAFQLLNSWGFHRYYIPAGHGGKLKSYEELYSLLKVASRRDASVGITHVVTYVGSSTVWVGATEEQKRRLARIVDANPKLAIGFHEKAHGHDFLACEVRATPTEGGYLLNGEKWVFGNATRADTLIVYARTNPEGGPRGFSLLLIEKKDLDPSSYSYHPKFKTHGVRGHEVSGIVFDNCFVPGNPILGRIGSGIETTFKSSQITRIINTALCLGGADTALRVTLRFALSRRLYGDTVFSIPHAQSVLVDAFLDNLICDCVSIGATRALQAATDLMNVWSAVVKYLVPTTVQGTLGDLASILGARYYLREAHCWGVFQKILRDCAMVNLTHLSSIVNLSHLAPQLSQLAKCHQQGANVNAEELRSRLESIFRLDKPLPDFDEKNLSLYNRGRDDVLQGLGISLEAVRTLSAQKQVAAETVALIASLTKSVIDELNTQDDIVLSQTPQEVATANRSPEHFELVRRYCALYAAAACLHMWLYNRERLGEFFSRGEWLVLCLDRLLRTFQPDRTIRPRPYVANIAHEVLSRYTKDELFSIVPLQLARTDNQFEGGTL
jgi:alkylation response protein AidB-like acyl-CoA dehydrogenase